MSELNFKDAVFHVARRPEECPRCHRSIVAIQRETYARFGDGFQAVFQCPGCRQLFITWFKETYGDFQLGKSEPLSHLPQKFDSLAKISPQFSTIYNQAASAEALSLTEIAGLGYRKSLEFLIKDYCISRDPEQSEAIKAEFLGLVIKNRVGDRKVRFAAEKVAWLGNDEAHYVRKWEDHDIDDLKRLLSIAVNGITEELEFNDLMASFEPKANN